jgi:hypothetical protein
MSEHRLTGDELAQCRALVPAECIGLLHAVDGMVAEIKQHRAALAVHAAAHPERLSEDVLAGIAGALTQEGRGLESVFMPGEAGSIVTEIQQRRAADLTPDEIAAMRMLMSSLDGEPRAMRTALEKLLRAHGATP